MAIKYTAVSQGHNPAEYLVSDEETRNGGNGERRRRRSCLQLNHSTWLKVSGSGDGCNQAVNGRLQWPGILGGLQCG